MKHKVIALTAALSMLGGAVTAFPAMAAGTADLILNGNMEQYEYLGGDPAKPRISHWNQSGDDQNRTYYNGSAEGVAIGDNASGILKCTNRWNEASAPRFFLEDNNKKLEENVEYTATAKVYSEEPARIKIAVAAKINCDGMGQEGHAHRWEHPDQVYSENTIPTTGGKWETITLKFTPETVYSSDNLPIYEGENLTFGGTFLSVQTLDPESGDFTEDFYVDDVSLTYESQTTESYVARVGDTEYTSLDDAIDKANSQEITLLKDATLKKAREWTTATIDGDGHTITVATPNGAVGSAIFGTLTLSNAKLTGSTNQNIANDASLTNVTVDDLNYDCLALFNFTAAGCKLEHNGGVFLFAGNSVDGQLSMTDTTITVKSLGSTSLLFRVPANDTPILSNVTINGLTDTDTKIAVVNDNTSIDGIKVNGLKDTQELKIVDGNLVIADKAMPASFTVMVGNAEVKNGTGDLENTVATGFQATIKNIGDIEGSFNTVNWNVTFNGETKTTGDQTITKVTLPKNAEATIALIIDGLDGADAKAKVSVE